jgi:Holliday junction resolvasome RuvABC DNA-binding subunit
LESAGVRSEDIDSVLLSVQWPSIQDAVKAKMADWRLNPPLQNREWSRLFRALGRLGYSEDEIREELEQLNEQH